MKALTTGGTTVQKAFAQRCATLNLPAWLFDASGAVISFPPQLPDGLDSDTIKEKVAQLIVASNHLDSVPIALSAGWRLMLFEERQGARRVSIAAALLPQSDAIDPVAAMLRWNFNDLVQSCRDRTTIQQFSKQLAQSYEENDVLLGLSRALNRITQPSDLFQKICDQLLETLPFGWVMIRFRPVNDEVRDLAGRSFLAGRPPCDVAAMERECQALLDVAHLPDLVRLQNPGAHSLATLAKSEVIVEPVMHDDRVIAIIAAGNKSGEDAGVKSGEAQFIAAAAGFLGIFHENIARFVEQEAQFMGTLRALTASIDAKDRYTRGHSERVAHLAWQMAAAIKLPPAEVETYRIAGIVHDVGKIGVPEAILCKPSRLTDEEFAKIQEHPRTGYEILKDVPRFAQALPAVLHHHERWDGRGYPDRLAGEKIPLMARVMGLADAFDAMSSNRSYRPAMTRDRVVAEMTRCAGGQFDPELVPTFVRLDFSGFDGLVTKHQAREKFAA